MAPAEEPTEKLNHKEHGNEHRKPKRRPAFIGLLGNVFGIDAVHLTVSNPTAELTRRREFIQASPDESSYETRPRRSRPTICYVAFRRHDRISLARTTIHCNGILTART